MLITRRRPGCVPSSAIPDQGSQKTPSEGAGTLSLQNDARAVFGTTADMADSLKDPKQDSIDSAIQHVQAQSVERASAHYFAFAGASWLITLSLPLLFFPRFLALLLGPPLTEDDQSGPSLRTLNGLETYLAQLTGLSFVAVALILVLQTGAVPLTSSLATAPGAAHGPETAVAQAAPFRTPTCAIATLFFATLGLASWQVGMRFIAFSSGSLAAFGVYVTLFGNEPEGHGKTSSMLFKNEADKKARAKAS